MEACYDDLEFDKDIENAISQHEKEKIIENKNQKKAEAEQKIFANLNETYEYYLNCLGLAYEVNGKKASGVFSHENVVMPCTTALIMVTRKTLKKLK